VLRRNVVNIDIDKGPALRKENIPAKLKPLASI
jgi:hypothetical protein